jgi:hypothetical protein
MFSLTQPGTPSAEEPRSLAPAPSPPPLPAAPPPAADEGGWPKDVHLPDEKEDDEC